jgi:hypothetical protein
MLYAAVGFGGGSTYNALLVLNGTDYRILPSIALACNIIVVTGGVIRFWRAGHMDVRRLIPFLVASIPAAWIGGRLPVSEILFVGLLGSALLLSGLHLAFQPASKQAIRGYPHKTSAPVGLGVGGAIGLLSGIVGIGGGIFLAPVLYFLRWGNPREIAAACSFFILSNSISGLTGQVMKLQDADVLALALPYWPVLPCVFVGGQIGSWLASERMPATLIKRLTAILVLYVAARLLFRWLALAQIAC